MVCRTLTHINLSESWVTPWTEEQAGSAIHLAPQGQSLLWPGESRCWAGLTPEDLSWKQLEHQHFILVGSPDTFLPFFQNTSPASAGCSKHKAGLQLPLLYEGWAWPNNARCILHPLPMWEVYLPHLWPQKWAFYHIPWSSFERTILTPNEGCFSLHFLFTVAIGVVRVDSSMSSCDETTVILNKGQFLPSHFLFSVSIGLDQAFPFS